MHSLELDKAAQIRERIKKLVTTDSSVVEKAIQSLQTDAHCKKWIDRAEEIL